MNFENFFSLYEFFTDPMVVVQLGLDFKLNTKIGLDTTI